MKTAMSERQIEYAIEKSIERYLTRIDFELPAPGCLDVEKVTKRIMAIIKREAKKQGKD